MTAAIPSEMDELVIVAPVMTALPALVTRPVGYLKRPTGSPLGQIAVGSSSIPGHSPALYIAVTDPAGETIVACVGGSLLSALRKNLDATFARIVAGDETAPWGQA